MYRSPPANKIGRTFLAYKNKSPIQKPSCDVFINHRGIDTKRTIVTLLYDHLSRLNLHPFLDNKNMKPGDKLLDNINYAIEDCRVAVTVFSPNYCDSYYCLHELARIMELKKKVIPIFCDIKPSQLCVTCDEICSKEDLERFARAIEEAKNIVGITFDSMKGDWSKVITQASESVINQLDTDGDGGKEAHTDLK